MIRRPYYYNSDGEPISLMEMAALLEDIHGRRVACTRILTKDGVMEVSTAFMVIDQDRLGPIPVLWESLIIGGPCNGAQHRYVSREAAIAGHEEVLAELLTVLSDLGVEVLNTSTLTGKLGRAESDEYDALVASLGPASDIFDGGFSLDEIPNQKRPGPDMEGEAPC